jgi:hypothetical protein
MGSTDERQRTTQPDAIDVASPSNRKMTIDAWSAPDLGGRASPRAENRYASLTSRTFVWVSAELRELRIARTRSLALIGLVWYRVSALPTLHQRRAGLGERAAFTLRKTNMSGDRLIFQPVTRVDQTVRTAIDVWIVDLGRVTHHD